MPQTRDIALQELTASDDALSEFGLRVDAAHSLGAALVGLLPLADMPVDQAITDLVQAEGAVPRGPQSGHLAAPLRQRQQELESREAQINARLADLQREVRDARVWLKERSGKLDARETQLNERDLEILAREAALGRPAADLTKPMSDVGPSDASKPRGEADCQERLQALLGAREQLAHRRTALEECWQESLRAHQRAQELRLLAEEMVTQLRLSLDVARAREAVTVIRERLAQRPRNETPQLTAQRVEFEWLKNDLASEQERLERQYEELMKDRQRDDAN
jgi:hypothetical protein